MPKMKTKKSAAKRFKVTGSGKVVYNKSGNRHLSTKKSPKRKRRLRKDATLSSAMTRRTKIMIQS
jgi:large subunit ribosomal protein L35